MVTRSWVSMPISSFTVGLLGLGAWSRCSGSILPLLREEHLAELRLLDLVAVGAGRARHVVHDADVAGDLEGGDLALAMRDDVGLREAFARFGDDVGDGGLVGL